MFFFRVISLKIQLVLRKQLFHLKNVCLKNLGLKCCEKVLCFYLLISYIIFGEIRKSAHRTFLHFSMLGWDIDFRSHLFNLFSLFLSSFFLLISFSLLCFLLSKPLT